MVNHGLQGAGSARRLLFSGLLLLFLCLSSCSRDSGFFQIQGKLNGINQGELYIYGDHGKHQLDTISIKKGEFDYRIPLEDTVTFVLVFPNFSELPIFGTSGTTVQVKGDATHLKETEVKGTKDNELMTAFRLQTSQQTPPEVVETAVKFIQEHPASPASCYILDKYFIRTADSDYQQACQLAECISKALPDDAGIKKLIQQLQSLQALKKGVKLPSFTAIDINGRNVSSADLYAKANVISVWATWNYESISQQNQLQRLQKKYGNDLKILSVCLDANIKDCKRIVNRDSIKYLVDCDGRMWDTPILQKTGLSYIPDNLVIDSQGKIVDHTLNYSRLTGKIEELLGEPKLSPP